MSTNKAFSLKQRWLLAWLLTLAIIPALSIYGRRLQTLAHEHLDMGILAWLIAIPTLLLVILVLIQQVRLGGYRRLWHLSWALALFGLLPLTLPAVEERLHFLVFGAFGLAAGRAFPIWLAVLLGTAAAGLDELLQWALPDRVGDWRDVGFNLLAVGGGLLLARLGHR
ncbi:MAG: VanZ family protein [Gammaproteobacteria bacterium]|nr:VanZ family protein [Gammaproteobacteria bacterium]